MDNKNALVLCKNDVQEFGNSFTSKIKPIFESLQFGQSRNISESVTITNSKGEKVSLQLKANLKKNPNTLSLKITCVFSQTGKEDIEYEYSDESNNDSLYQKFKAWIKNW